MLSIPSISSPGKLYLGFIRATEQKDEALERLSTGKRINSAADDPSGLVAAENLKADITRLEGLIKRGERELQWLGATDGALGVISDLLTELEGLVVTGANKAGLSDAEKQSLQLEAIGILDAINYANDTARFNGQQVLGTFGTRQLGTTYYAPKPDADPDADPDPDNTAVPSNGRYYRLDDLRNALSLDGGDMEIAQSVVEQAKDRVVGAQAGAGARSKSIESELNSYRKTIEETTGALSVIEDADFAAEAAKLVRAQLLEEASLSAILIGRQSAETVLELLAPPTQRAQASSVL